MPYFFILPAFILYVLAMSIAVAVASLYRPAAFLRPYAVAVLIWSSVGFIASAILYALALVLSVQAMDRATGRDPSIAGRVAMGGMIFVAPFVVSAAGLLGGTMVGVWRGRAKTRRVASRGTEPGKHRSA
jgi:hypothetical protein